MEIMAMPSKEVLLFIRKIHPWLIGDEDIEGKKRFIFREDTPTEILDLYEEIKPILSFVYQG
ncbi:hypothetical protein [Tuanshanicoccus lijuaniae]|uniref:hypothetical protein n=1 Tax=Aerococcaceae bacterium zg-1292 TaxID=2774330 RepID=UPI001BD90CF5|nr:hypothetical protein [Aerococcaceae bacterium zg-A91]MBS4458463.1 hypothetical protein [Aerococcaceae bacterium zg-BR33]